MFLLAAVFLVICVLLTRSFNLKSVLQSRIQLVGGSSVDVELSPQYYSPHTSSCEKLQ